MPVGVVGPATWGEWGRRLVITSFGAHQRTRQHGCRVSLQRRFISDVVVALVTTVTSGPQGEMGRRRGLSIDFARHSSFRDFRPAARDFIQIAFLAPPAAPGPAPAYQFKHSRVNLSDEFRNGCPPTAVNNKNIDAVRRMIRNRQACGLP
ncbi:hypothetical protein EVAR_62805_1 [Eumeta japonica]|uniref:Uncharacterized protein n=1 Tax=Eumeta variegata TaxID=151549 RepID=A0A4C1ZRS9_EUMVA|nr:hypothetical protein EVAR_62805_1 [Eumeta japonica]